MQSRIHSGGLLMKTKLKKSERQFMENAMVDTTRLRAALMIACTELAGDPLQGLLLAEHFYDEAPQLLKELTSEGFDNLPGAPALVVPFPKK